MTVSNSYTSIQMKGVRFANIIAVWKWSYKPIYMLVFPQYFLLNGHPLNGFIYIWNNKAQFLKKKIIMKCLMIKIFAWNFLQLPVQKYNQCIVTIEKSNLAFLLILYFDGEIDRA